jgi:CRP-like cAMP-binding protein
LTVQPLVEYFKNYLPLKDEDIKMLAARVTQRQVKRRQMILQEGFVCRHYTFVEKGCFKLYGVDESGTEHNLRFAAENDWIADLGSFYSEKPSRLFIEAVEASVILQIERQDLLFLFINVHKFDRNFRIIVEEKFIELQNRLLQNFSSNAHQCYLDFLEQYPALAQRLPNTQIASYLGITPEFLSKIRGEKLPK